MPAKVRASCRSRFFVGIPEIERRLELSSKGMPDDRTVIRCDFDGCGMLNNIHRCRRYRDPDQSKGRADRLGAAAVGVQRKNGRRRNPIHGRQPLLWRHYRATKSGTDFNRPIHDAKSYVV